MDYTFHTGLLCIGNSNFLFLYFYICFDLSRGERISHEFILYKLFTLVNAQQ